MAEVVAREAEEAEAEAEAEEAEAEAEAEVMEAARAEAPASTRRSLHTGLLHWDCRHSTDE